MKVSRKHGQKNTYFRNHRKKRLLEDPNKKEVGRLDDEENILRSNNIVWLKI